VRELDRRPLLIDFCVASDCEFRDVSSMWSAFRRMVSITGLGRSERISSIKRLDVSTGSRSESSAAPSWCGKFLMSSWIPSMRRFAVALALPFLCSCAFAASTGGSCPTSPNYVNVANEGQTGTLNVTLASLGVTSCYYVGVGGADSNAGTTEAAPFLHIPGTPNFNGSAPLGPGIGIIIEGGYTAHFGATTSPATGGALTIKTGGSSGSPVYYGIDPKWYNGSSFARPVFNGDNPLSTGFPSSCTYDNSSLGNFVNIASSASYVILDGIESTGRCWSSGVPDVINTSTSSHYIYMERWYVHGWTTPKTSTDSSYAWWDGSGATDYDIVALNVVDGTDSSAGALGSSNCQYSGYSTNSPCYSGGAIYEGAYIVWGNVFQHLSNVAVTLNTIKWHDNYVNNLMVTYQNGGQHTNCNNEIKNVSGSNNYFYNNLTTNVQATECYYLAVSAGNTIYGFNNVFWGNMNYIIGKAASGCVFLNLISSSGSATLYWTNNTMDATGGSGGGCQLRFEQANSPLYAWNGTAYIENTEAIGYTSLTSLYVKDSSATLAMNDLGGEVYQTESTANGQGYTTTDNYAPTSTSGASYHAGNNLTSLCSTIPDSYASAACANGSGEGVSAITGWGGEVANYPGIPIKPRGNSWDAGAYQYQIAPAAPLNVQATPVPQ
jgi:hypothetical protein